MARCGWLALVLALGAIAYAGSGNGSHTTLTVWAAAPPALPAYGGATYGGYTPPTGAMITEKRDVDVDGGEVRLPGVASTIDPASVQFRDLSDPAAAVREQRFVPGAATPDEILARHIGEPVSVVTVKGEVTGTLRAVDAQTLVVEIGSGDQRRLQILQRSGYVQDVRLAAAGGPGADKPSLVWKLATKKPGKHSVEVSYRADGMAWTADYVAVVDAAKKTIDFSAWATIKNASGASFDGAELILAAKPQQATGAQKFAVATPVKINAGESVQVELFPPRTGAKSRPVVTFEAMPDPSASFQAYPATDCTQWAISNAAGARAEAAVELDVPATAPLPDGRVRLFERKGDRLESVSEEPLRSSAGLARVRLAPSGDVTGERKALACTYDDRARVIHEKIEVDVQNKGKQPVDVAVREFLWRWPMWKLDEESQKGSRGGAQTQEYRVSLPPGAKKSITYGVTYSW